MHKLYVLIPRCQARSKGSRRGEKRREEGSVRAALTRRSRSLRVWKQTDKNGTEQNGKVGGSLPPAPR